MRQSIILSGLGLAMFTGLFGCGVVQHDSPAIPAEIPMDQEFVYRLKVLGID